MISYANIGQSPTNGTRVIRILLTNALVAHANRLIIASFTATILSLPLSFQGSKMSENTGTLY